MKCKATCQKSKITKKEAGTDHAGLTPTPCRWMGCVVSAPGNVRCPTHLTAVPQGAGRRLLSLLGSPSLPNLLIIILTHT